MTNPATNEITAEIKKLAAERDAVILAHYYVDGQIQEIADYVGDSYALAKIAKNDPRKTIVFCGVTFMGESACILNPDKTVLVPNTNAVCPMALMADPEKIAEMRQKYDDLAVVCYINSTAEIKALSDVIVTSSNALKIVKCFHEHQNAKIITHPECIKEVVDLSDYVGSTKELIEFVKTDDAQEYIVCTESGVLHEMQKVAPGKKFYFVGAKQICPNMKRITLENIRDCLKNNTPKASCSAELCENASKPLARMLEIAK